jgi:aldehyde dehydrogenase (NAD+)
LYGTVIRINEPVGVIGIVCPSNDVTGDATPLLSFVSLFAAAVSRGNAVIVVPHEEFPLPALDMYQIFDTSDLPGRITIFLHE